MTLALPRTFTHAFKWSLSTIHSEIRFIAVFDMSLLYILITMFASATTGVLIMRASQQFSNTNVDFNRYRSQKFTYEYTTQYINRININFYTLMFVFVGLYIIYEIRVSLCIQYINTNMVSFCSADM